MDAFISGQQDVHHDQTSRDQRLTAEWVRLRSAHARREPVRGYDFGHCATDIDQERARQEARAAAEMAQQFSVGQGT